MTTDYILQRQEDLRKLKKLERQAEKLKAAWNAKEALDEEAASKSRLEAKLARMRGEKAPEPKQEAKPTPKPKPKTIGEAALSLASDQPEKNTVKKKKPASKRKPIVRSKK